MVYSRKKSRGSTSAGELMVRLQNDPDWVRRDQERQAREAARESQLDAEERAIVAELACAGYRVKSVYDLVNTATGYPEAIPILQKHLPLPYDSTIREGIARALTVKEARGPAGRAILDELKRRGGEPPSTARWALANALTVAGDASMVQEIEALISDPRYANERSILGQALKRLTHRRKPAHP
jgi:hypothetical protein